MKVALVGYLHGSGGAERQIVMLANALVRRGHETYLIALAEYNKKYDIDDRVIVCDLTAIENESGNKILLRYRALKKEFRDIHTDVTIHYWLQSAYLTAIMQKSVRGKIIYSERGDPGDSEYKGLLGIVRSWTFKHIDGFVFQSECARDYFGDKMKGRSIIIHNSVAVPTDKYTVPCKEREKKIVSVGRLHPQKNQKLLIEAFSMIASEFPDFRLEIYGDGKLKDELTEQINKLGVDGKAILHGSCEDIFDCIYPASLFVLTSDYEGMPNTLMEAMALGIPCISTDCRPGGAKTLIQDGENGFIVPIGDVNALAERMRHVLNNSCEAESIARNAQNIVKTHSQNVVFNKWNQYILSILKKEIKVIRGKRP